MKSLWIAVLGVAFLHHGQAMGDAVESWPALEQALQGPLVQVERAKADPRLFKLPGVKCPKLPVEDVRAYSATIRFEPGRTLKTRILVGKLPTGYDVYGPIVASAHEPGSEHFLDGCLMPKSGLSLLQIGQYLFEFPTVCSAIDPYKKSLPIVLKAFRVLWGAHLPKKFIYAPCGTLYPRLVDVDEYLGHPPARKPPALSRPVP